MNFLKKLGTALSNIFKVAQTVEPAINSVLPNSVQQKIVPIEDTVNSELTDIAGELAAAQQVAATLESSGTNLTDEQKVQIALPMISQILLTSPFLKGKSIKNEAQYTSGASQIAEGIATILDATQ